MYKWVTQNNLSIIHQNCKIIILYIFSKWGTSHDFRVLQFAIELIKVLSLN